jgi:hypothetical protein
LVLQQRVNYRFRGYHVHLWNWNVVLQLLNLVDNQSARITFTHVLWMGAYLTDLYIRPAVKAVAYGGNQFLAVFSRSTIR